MKLIRQVQENNLKCSQNHLRKWEWSVWNDKIDVCDNQFVLFNTCTHNAVLMDLSEMKNPEYMNEKDRETLCQYGFLVDSDFDEKGDWEQKFNKARYDMSYIDLTILLTENCQMRCLYCFEGAKNKKSISANTMDGILTFLNSCVGVCKKLRVTWFGGEPLVAYQELKELSIKLISFCKDNSIEYVADMTTNGFALNSNRCYELVEELKVKRFIVTIDGPERIHEQRRPSVTNKPTYRIIMRNIKLLTEFGAWVTLRMTIDKNNIAYIPEFLDSFANSSLKGRVGLAFCRTIDYNFTSEDIKSYIYTDSEFVDVEWNLIQYAHKLGLWQYDFPHSAPLGGCLRQGDIVIGVEGKIYKCQDTLGDEKWIVGKIGDSGNENATTPKWLTYWNSWSPYDSDNCANCPLVPLCNGGCPHNALFNDKKHGSNIGCPDWKGNYKRQIKSLIIEKYATIQ